MTHLKLQRLQYPHSEENQFINTFPPIFTYHIDFKLKAWVAFCNLYPLFTSCNQSNSFKSIKTEQSKVLHLSKEVILFFQSR